MESAARCDGPSFWPADESQDRAPVLAPMQTPAAAHAPLSELSAFLAASGDPLAAHGAVSSTLLDELLGANDDLEQLSAARTDGAALLDAGLGCPGARAPPHASARLLQLEDNYERKKKRAKINRKDLNARFQELMELLHLREDRKLNRAKVLEKAIERIEQLTAELEATKAQLGGSRDPLAAKHSHFSRPSSAHSAAAAMGSVALPARRAADHARVGGVSQALGGPSTTAMVPIAAGTHPWGSTASSALSLAPMVWVPCPVMSHPVQAALPLGADRDGRSDGSKRRRLTRTREVSASDTDSSVDEQPPAETTRCASNRSSAACDVALIPASPTSVAVWAVHEIPTVLQFCDAWTLVSVMQTCKELERAARREELWVALLRRRWRVAVLGPQRLRAMELWAAWHASNRMPDYSSITPEGVHFATGRKRNVSAWGLLSRRSNGRTTRTVLVGGRATVMQVVELYIVVQNMGLERVRLTDRIAVTTGDTRRQLASPFTADSGAHLTPHVVAFNSKLCTTAGVAGVALLHGDACVLSVFLECEGLDLEDEFLQRAGKLLVEVESRTPSGCTDVVEIHAQCHAVGGAQYKRALSR